MGADSVTVEHRLRLPTPRDQAGLPLPDFAMGAVKLGRELHKCALSGRPRVVILTLPTRDFYSALMSLGAAESAVTHSGRAMSRPEPGDLVVALCDNGQLYIAIFEGDVEDARSPTGTRTKLLLKGNQSISMYSSAVTLLNHAKGPHANAGLSTLGSAQQVPTEVIAAQQAFGLSAVHELHLGAPASTIVGTKSHIEADMEEMRFVIADSPGSPVTLGEILLAKRSKLLPPLVDSQAYASADLGSVRSPLVILDGANVPLRHGIHVGSSSQVILFDSTTSQATLDLAVSSIANQVAFYTQDPDWPPLHDSELAQTERVSYFGPGS